MPKVWLRLIRLMCSSTFISRSVTDLLSRLIVIVRVEPVVDAMVSDSLFEEDEESLRLVPPPVEDVSESLEELECPLPLLKCTPKKS